MFKQVSFKVLFKTFSDFTYGVEVDLSEQIDLHGCYGSMLVLSQELL